MSVDFIPPQSLALDHSGASSECDYAFFGDVASPYPVALNSRVDLTKYRTKMCRTCLMGIPCPFEGRCIFAHGDDDLRPNSMPASAPEMSGDFVDAGALSNNEMHAALSIAPPSYDTFLMAQASDIESPAFSDSAPGTPPAYGARFRHDPYGDSGVIFSCEM